MEINGGGRGSACRAINQQIGKVVGSIPGTEPQPCPDKGGGMSQEGHPVQKANAKSHAVCLHIISSASHLMLTTL